MNVVQCDKCGKILKSRKDPYLVGFRVNFPDEAKYVGHASIHICRECYEGFIAKEEIK